MKKFTLEYKDKLLESLYQNDKKIIKPIDFYKFLILELCLDMVLMAVDYIPNIIEKPRTALAYTSFFTVLIIFVLIMVTKCQKYKYTLHILGMIQCLAWF